MIESDGNFNGGHYYDAEPGHGPHRGLAAARIVAQVTYRSEEVYANRFDRQRKGSGAGFGLGTEFEVESYLNYHGDKLVRRFDANSYIRLNRAMDLHDIGRGRSGLARSVCRRTTSSSIAPTATMAFCSHRSRSADRWNGSWPIRRVPRPIDRRSFGPMWRVDDDDSCAALRSASGRVTGKGMRHWNAQHLRNRGNDVPESR